MQNKIVLVLSLLLSLSLQSTFYVSTSGNDSNSGSLQSPWASIQKAADTMQPGDTVIVQSGTYYEKINIYTSGTSGNYITYQADGQVLISGSGIANNQASYTDDIIYMENVDFIEINGFEIGYVNTVEGSGIRLFGHSDGVRILNNEIHEIRGGGQSGGAMGITIYGSDDNNSIKNIIIDGNEIYDCDPAWSEALTLNGNVEFFEVTNNVVHDVNNIGIDMIGGESWLSSQYARNGTCSHNIVYNAKSSYEDEAAAGIYVDGGSDILISDNVVYNCNFGIEIGAENQGVVVQNVNVTRNEIYDNDSAGIIFGGYAKSVGRVKYCYFTENRLTNNDKRNSWIGEIWVQWSRYNVIERNVISPDNTKKQVTYSESGANKNNVIRNNAYCNADIGNYEWVWSGDWYWSLPNFQAGSGQGQNSQLYYSNCQQVPIPQ